MELNEFFERLEREIKGLKKECKERDFSHDWEAETHFINCVDSFTPRKDVFALKLLRLSDYFTPVDTNNDTDTQNPKAEEFIKNEIEHRR
jgi:hypothetical protein